MDCGVGVLLALSDGEERGELKAAECWWVGGAEQSTSLHTLWHTATGVPYTHTHHTEFRTAYTA